MDSKRIQENCNELYRRIGVNILHLRKKAGLTQEDLAEKVNINSQSLISQYEHGKKAITFEKLIELTDFFGVSLEDLLFSDLSKNRESSKNMQSSSLLDSISPIHKCAGRTYYCYYIQEHPDEKGNYLNRIVCRRIDILPAESAYVAPALLYKTSERDSDTIRGELNMDESYAYIRFHDRQHDYYFGLCFFYYRQRSRKNYAGGLAIVQTVDRHNVPVFQFCIVSGNAISGKHFSELKKLLQIEIRGEDRLSNLAFSSQAIVRLTKEKVETP